MKAQYALFTFFFVAMAINAQNDIAGSEDHLLFERLPSYSISRYTEIEFDSYEFYYEGKKHIHEGRKYFIEYKHDNYKQRDYQFPSRLQILRNYSNAIKKAGGQVLFERHNAEHGNYRLTTKDQKEMLVQVRPQSSGKIYSLIIIEKEKMRQDLVIDAELIKSTIALEGKIAIYDILFDTGKSVIKPESDAALEQIAKYLNDNPNINCWVVGHTDSTGSFKTNSQLSLDRAKSIKNELLSRYGIADERLWAEGVGPLAPISTNDTDEGKRLNRRVEFVKK